MSDVAAGTSGNGPGDWHAIEPAEAVARLETDADRGLSSAEAAARLQRYGANVLPEGRRKGPLLRYLAHFHNVLIYVLFNAGLVQDNAA